MIFSLREDYLAHLDEARGDLPDLLGDSRRLTALDSGNASVAITEPAARAGVMVEPALVDVLVGGDGSKGAGDLVEADGQVPPAVLQIVMDRLYHDALPAGHPPNDPPPAGLPLTLDATGPFATGRARATTTANWPAPRPSWPATSTRRWRGCPSCGAAMAPSGRRSGHRPGHPQGDGHQPEDQGCAQAGRDGRFAGRGRRHQQGDPRDRELVEATRLGLEQVRLVRSFERGGQAFYELAHDTMAAEIATWISQEELAGKMAREFLRRGLDDWQQPGEAVAAAGDPGADPRAARGSEAAEPGRAGVALPLGAELMATRWSTWFDRAQRAGVPADAIALEGLRSDSFRTRAAAVLALGQLDKRFADALIPMLADLYPQVRAAAIASAGAPAARRRLAQPLKYECYVPAGEFIMGDDKGDNDDEKPAHRVTVDAYLHRQVPGDERRVCALQGGYPPAVSRCRLARKTIRWSRSAGTTPATTPRGRACGC